MSNIPDEIKDLITEACSLEYCPVEFRVWAANTLSTGSAAALIRIPDARWISVRINLYWAVLFSYPDDPGRIRHMASARAALEGIKHAHDNPRAKNPD